MNMKLLFHIYWGVGIFLTPLFIKITDQPVSPRFSRDQLFCALIALSVILFGFFKPLAQANKHFLIYVMIILPLAFLNRAYFNSIEYCHQLICFLAGLVLIAQLLCNLDFEYKNIIKNALIATCLAQSAVVIIGHYFNIDLYREIILGSSKTIYFKGSYAAAFGTEGNPNSTGGLLAMTAPFLLKVPYLLPIGLVATGLTSTMPVLSLLTGTIAIIWIKVFKCRFKIPVFILGSGSFLAACYYSHKGVPYLNDSGRFNSWKNTLTFFKNNDYAFKSEGYWILSDIYNYLYPYYYKIKYYVFGRGLGFFSDFYYRVFGGEAKMRQVHNEFLEYSLAFGLIGVIAALWFFWSQRKKIIEGDRLFLYSFLVSLANSFGNFPYHIASTSLVGIMSLSMILKGKEGETCGA